MTQSKAYIETKETELRTRDLTTEMYISCQRRQVEDGTSYRLLVFPDH